MKWEGSHGRVRRHPYKGLGKFRKLASWKCIWRGRGIMSSFCKQKLWIIYGALTNTSTKWLHESHREFTKLTSTRKDVQQQTYESKRYQKALMFSSFFFPLIVHSCVLNSIFIIHNSQLSPRVLDSGPLNHEVAVVELVNNSTL